MCFLKNSISYYNNYSKSVKHFSAHWRKISEEIKNPPQRLVFLHARQHFCPPQIRSGCLMPDEQSLCPPPRGNFRGIGYGRPAAFQAKAILPQILKREQKRAPKAAVFGARPHQKVLRDRPVSRVLSSAVIYLGASSPMRSSGVHGRIRAGNPYEHGPTLHRTGFTWHGALPSRR